MGGKNSTFSISSTFDMWVDNDVLNGFPTLKNFYRSPFSKWPPRYQWQTSRKILKRRIAPLMVTYPVVPEICRRQVHVPKKERRKRRKRIIIKITRYDYNLTIMKSPKSATDNYDVPN
jgi:hypothetical protein